MPPPPAQVRSATPARKLAQRAITNSRSATRVSQWTSRGLTSSRAASAAPPPGRRTPPPFGPGAAPGATLPARRERGDPPLGPPAHRARVVERGGERGAAGKDEAGERREVRLEPVDLALDPGHVVVRDAREPGEEREVGRGELGAHLEEGGLKPRDELAEPPLGIERVRDTQCRIELVDAAVRLDARVVLGDAGPAEEPGRPVVPGAGVDLHGGRV